ncbi:MAG: hypothetical protein KatS3mg046_131 [Bellilinea sp.]|nr:MAG: hypothetical protein KatS3mg046_131 [Bellilinea sp.]
MSITPSRHINHARIAGSQQFLVGDKVVSLYSGAVHYWRLDRDKWDDILDKVIGMGFNAITSYIPWEIHEIKPGEFDFGQIKPSNDIDAFITLCENKGLYVIVRPGPQINSELTWFGYPRRILEDQQLQAQTAMGSKAVLTQVPKPIPALCYAEDKFFEETAVWYDAIMKILAKHAYPKGNLIACQVDNEMAFFFHINPYACDFHPASIKGYREFLKVKYGSLEKLNSIHRKQYPSFDSVDAPRRFEGNTKEDIPSYTDWIEYREHYLVNSLQRLANMMRERGLNGIPLFHNYPHPLGPGGSVSGITTPFNLLALEDKLDFVGFDIYSRRELYDHIKTVVSYVVGTSRYPFIPEFIAGVWPWYLNPGDIEDEEFVTKAALMHGIKGFSRYMVVDRQRWLASPISVDGRIRKENYNMFRRVNNLAKSQNLVLMKRRADVLLIANRDYDRLEAASVLVTFPGDFLEPLLGFSEYPNFMSVSEKTLGFKEPIQVAKSVWFTKYYKALTDMGYLFLLGDSALPVDRLQAYKALVVTSFEFMGFELQKNLLAYAKDGGTVIFGPQVPELDESMFPNTIIKDALDVAAQTPLISGNVELGTIFQVGKGRLIHLPKMDDADVCLTAALQELDVVKVSKSDTRLDVTVHTSADQDKMVVFVCNPTADSVTSKMQINMPFQSMYDLWENQPVAVEDGSWVEELPPYTIKIYECTI